MHDTAALEEAGVATAFVASEVFEQAAAVQARSLGTSPTVLLVEHPIQDRSDDEMIAIADRLSEQLIASITT